VAAIASGEVPPKAGKPNKFDMYYTYILKSKNHNRYYIGHTESLDDKLKIHNRGKVKSTKAFVPWKIVYTESYNTKSEAYKREMQIKSYKSGEAFHTLIK